MEEKNRHPIKAGPSEVIKSKPLADKDNPDEGTFICFACGLEEHFHYRGKHPPFATSIQFLDDSYIMRDPFAPAKPTPSIRRHREVNEPFLILGADCTSCKRPVCRDPECSIFYKHHFCIPCALKFFDIFPLQIQKKLKK